VARNDDSFWRNVFRKSPLIASLMAMGGLIGLGIGVYHFGDLERLPVLSLVLGLIASTTLGGMFVGVLVDSLIGVFRDKDNKRKDKPRRYD
jgi:zinc transporter ZupT